MSGDRQVEAKEWALGDGPAERFRKEMGDLLSQERSGISGERRKQARDKALEECLDGLTYDKILEQIPRTKSRLFPRIIRRDR